MKLKGKLLIIFMINILLLQNFINLVSEHQKKFAATLAQANLASKNDIGDFVKIFDEISMIN